VENAGRITVVSVTLFLAGVAACYCGGGSGAEGRATSRGNACSWRARGLLPYLRALGSQRIVRRRIRLLNARIRWKRAGGWH